MLKMRYRRDASEIQGSDQSSRFIGTWTEAQAQRLAHVDAKHRLIFEWCRNKDVVDAKTTGHLEKPVTAPTRTSSICKLTGYG